jgi:signal transduction histidine kinase
LSNNSPIANRVAIRAFPFRRWCYDEAWKFASGRWAQRPRFHFISIKSISHADIIRLSKPVVFIAGVREGIDRGLQLTSQLLPFAKQRKLEAGKGNANELLRQLELFLRSGVGCGIRIVLALAPDIPNCLLDPSQFNAAILNLVVNARDAMPNGGEIQISTTRWQMAATTKGSPAPGTYVRVRVKDSGQGMPPRTLQRIFDPFFTTKDEQGTGLGLPQVCAFMRLIGGHVSVTSESGNGTTFDLLFPSFGPTDL